jgi:hypothetical protein
MSYKEYTVKVHDDGVKHWLMNGKLHREDGPAFETDSGSKYWFLNGNLHREDGPAVEWTNGIKEWYLNGKLHREDGPAIEYANGTKRWFLDGKEYSKPVFLKKTSPVKEYTVAELEKLLGHPVKIVKG